MSGEDPLRDEDARIEAIRRYGLCDSGEDRIAARAGFRRPDRDPLYGFRPEVWWKAPAE